MPFTPRVRLVAYDDAGQVPGADKTFSYEVDSLLKIVASCLQSVTTVINCPIDKDALSYLCLIADKPCKLETNAVGVSAGDSVTLSANVPRIWTADVGGANPFATEDVVDVRITPTLTGVTVFRLVAGVDPTP